MTSLQVIVLSIVQGITEFFPISSSGHLVILESFFNLPVQSLISFDIAVHFGSLLAIVVYFMSDFRQLFSDLTNLILNMRSQTIKKLKQNEIIFLFLGTIPAVVIGLLLKSYMGEYFRSVKVVSILMIVVAIYFLIAESLVIKKAKNTIFKSILIGVSQAFAILPGVSRSGSTIATGILCGLEREKAARFSFLLGSIAILGASILEGIEILEVGLDISIDHLLLGVIVSFVSSFLSVNLLMKMLKKYSLKVFSVYLIIVGCLILFFV